MARHQFLRRGLLHRYLLSPVSMIVLFWLCSLRRNNVTRTNMSIQIQIQVCSKSFDTIIKREYIHVRCSYHFRCIKRFIVSPQEKWTLETSIGNGRRVVWSFDDDVNLSTDSARPNVRWKSLLNLYFCQPRQILTRMWISIVSVYTRGMTWNQYGLCFQYFY